MRKRPVCKILGQDDQIQKFIEAGNENGVNSVKEPGLPRIRHRRADQQPEPRFLL
jgi:hypothetical protein